MSAGQIIEVSNPSYLKTEKQQLLIKQHNSIVASIPFEDLQAILLSHPQITVSIGVLQRCIKHNLPVIVCDDKYLPCGFFHAPLSNSLHTKIIKYQVGAKLPLKKQIWKRIVQAKIRHQASLLKAEGKSSNTLMVLQSKVRSGDPDNIEAQAASVYWQELFGNRFRRDQNADGINSLLNYGYAVVRAATARALAGSGLNTTLGIFHRNQYNHFCLADDLMEVARPMVDAKVFEMVGKEIVQITSQSKSELLSILQSEVKFMGEAFYLTNALQRSSKSLSNALAEQDHKIFQPIELIR
jgi:CRISP-associated protein Cas1